MGSGEWGGRDRRGGRQGRKGRKFIDCRKLMFFPSMREKYELANIPLTAPEKSSTSNCLVCAPHKVCHFGGILGSTFIAT